MTFRFVIWFPRLTIALDSDSVLPTGTFLLCNRVTIYNFEKNYKQFKCQRENLIKARAGFFPIEIKFSVNFSEDFGWTRLKIRPIWPAVKGNELRLLIFKLLFSGQQSKALTRKLKRHVARISSVSVTRRYSVGLGVIAPRTRMTRFVVCWFPRQAKGPCGRAWRSRGAHQSDSDKDSPTASSPPQEHLPSILLRTFDTILLIRTSTSISVPIQPAHVNLSQDTFEAAKKAIK